MDRRLNVARAVAVAATVLLVPTAAVAIVSRVFLPIAVLEAAILAIATAYAVYLGVYRYPR